MAKAETDQSIATMEELAEHGIVLHMDGGIVHDATCNGKKVPVRVVAHDYDVEGIDDEEEDLLVDKDGDEYVVVEIA